MCLSDVSLSIFYFWIITRVNTNEFSPNLVCALMLWRSCLGLLMPTTHLYFHFWMITSVNVNGFSPNLVSALVL